MNHINGAGEPSFEVYRVVYPARKFDDKRGVEITDVALVDVAVGDILIIYPHDICPVDGAVRKKD